MILLFFAIVLQKLHQQRGVYRGQTRSNDAFGVGYRDTRTLYAIVNCKDSSHIFIYYFSVQRYKKKLIQLKIVTCDTIALVPQATVWLIFSAYFSTIFSVAVPSGWCNVA